MRRAFYPLSLSLLCLTIGANAQKTPAPLNLHPTQGNPPDAHTIRLHQALLEAAQTSDIATIQSLLAQSADINVIEDYSKTHTPLTYAAESGNVKMTKFLLAHGADPNGRGVNSGSECSEPPFSLLAFERCKR